MTKVSQTTKPTRKPSLSDYITPDIEAAFEAKAHLLAAWDLCNAMLMDDDNEQIEGRIKSAFQECSCIVDDCIDETMTAAAQAAADKMRSRNTV